MADEKADDSPEQILDHLRKNPASEEALIRAAGLLRSEDTREQAEETLLQSLEKVLPEKEKADALLRSIREAWPEEETIAEFTENAGKAGAEVMNRVYQKIINPRSGTPCCPECGSGNIGEDGGVYEFTLMKCYSCGNEQYCDSWQIGDWYA